MNTATIHSVRDVLQASTDVLSAFPGQPWWRGHGEEDWQLVPKVHREDRGIAYEANLINKFVQRAPTRHSSCPEPGQLSRWLFLAQHYGLPTRLLDWTESPLIALYFAVWEDQCLEKPGALWALDPYALTERAIGERAICQPGYLVAHELIESAFNYERADDNRIVALVTEEVDLRMMVQLSGLTIHGSLDPLESLTDVGLFVRKYVVDAAAKEDIRRELKSIGIRERSVFPDLDHLANDLRGDWYGHPAETRPETHPADRPATGGGSST